MDLSVLCRIAELGKQFLLSLMGVRGKECFWGAEYKG